MDKPFPNNLTANYTTLCNKQGLPGVSKPYLFYVARGSVVFVKRDE